MITGDMVMASTSASTGRSPMTTDSDLSRLGGIEALKLKAGPVRRNLFGSVDHQQLEQDFKQLLHMSVEEANKRWNFDFQSDRPGEGSSIEWVELGQQDVPAFYRSCTVWPAVRPRAEMTRRTSSSSGEGSPASSSSSGSGDEYLEVTTRGCYRIQRSGKRKQSAITDFFKVKKRRLLHYKASLRQ